MNILVLCTGNSARSILLEHLLRREGFTTFSAGSKPSGKVHPASLKLLNSLGYDTSAARSKSWDEFGLDDSPVMDAVITVCGSAAEEECPFWPGSPITVHWGIEDPAAAEEADWDSAFALAYVQLEAKVVAMKSVADTAPLAERLAAGAS